jgi:hypothetical protein
VSTDLAAVTAFIEARLAEAEARANATSPGGTRLGWHASHEPAAEDEAPAHWVLSDPPCLAAAAHAMGLERGTGDAVAEHIALHDPASALREVAALRLIMAEHPHVPASYETSLTVFDFGCQACCRNDDSSIAPTGWCATARAVASIWSTHAEYGERWKP